VVDKNVIVGRAQQIEGHLAKIAPYMSLSLKKFLDDPVAQDIVEYNLFRTVNHLIDMVQHIVVDEGYGFPDSAYEAAEILRKKGILKQTEVEVFKKMIGFRNVVGHDYISINKRTVYTVLTRGQEDIRALLSRIVKKFL
jgi:uncharacterized protein YutE (UPF0331/DUF86 family)